MARSRQVTVELARTDVRALHQEELKLCDERLAAKAKVPQIHARAGARVLDARLKGTNPADSTARDVARVDTELAVLDAAINEARRRRLEAVQAVWTGEVNGLHDQAAMLRREADERQLTTDRLLKELEEFEGCTYEPSQPTESRPAINPDARRPPPGRGVAPETVLYGPEIVRRIVSKTAMLRIQAEDLDRRAQEVASRQVEQSGMVTGASPEELIAAIRALDPARMLGPRPDHAAEWAREAHERQQARQRRHREEDGRHPGIRLELHWRNGELDERASRSFIPALDE